MGEYRLRPAASPDEDLEAIRIFGHGLYGFDPKALAGLKTREDLAAAGMKMAMREGHTVVLDHGGDVVGASRITPSPWGTRDPATGELEHWETVAIRPEHQGQGLSTPLRRAALDSSPAVVIKSRIKSGNPKSWGVAEKLGFEHVDDDGHEKIYVMRRPERALQSAAIGVRSEAPMKKTAAQARVVVALAKLAGVDPNAAGAIGALSIPAAAGAAAIPGLLGAGVGGVLGGVNDDPADRRTTGDKLLRGAATGAVTGVGAGAGGALGALLGHSLGGNSGIGMGLGTLGGGTLAYLLSKYKKAEKARREDAALAG